MTANPNNIDFSIIRERALRNIRQDLLSEWGKAYPARVIEETFDAVTVKHKNAAVVEDFVPVLVEAEMKERLRGDDIGSST